MKKEQKSFDKLLWGFVPALILPILGILILFAFQKDNLQNISLVNYLSYILHYDLISKVLSVTLISNLIIFYIFLHGDRYRAVRGVLTATALYAVTIVLYMFVF